MIHHTCIYTCIMYVNMLTVLTYRGYFVLIYIRQALAALYPEFDVAP